MSYSVLITVWVASKLSRIDFRRLKQLVDDGSLGGLYSPPSDSWPQINVHSLYAIMLAHNMPTDKIDRACPGIKNNYHKPVWEREIKPERISDGG